MVNICRPLLTLCTRAIIILPTATAIASIPTPSLAQARSLCQLGPDLMITSSVHSSGWLTAFWFSGTTRMTEYNVGNRLRLESLNNIEQHSRDVEVEIVRLLKVGEVRSSSFELSMKAKRPLWPNTLTRLSATGKKPQIGRWHRRTIVPNDACRKSNHTND